jgi:hypothetical protein
LAIAIPFVKADPKSPISPTKYFGIVLPLRRSSFYPVNESRLFVVNVFSSEKRIKGQYRGRCDVASKRQNFCYFQESFP